MSGAREYRVQLSSEDVTSPSDLFNPFSTVLSFLSATSQTSELRVPTGRLAPNATYYWIVGAVDDAVDPDDITMSPVTIFTTRAGTVVLDTTPPVVIAAPAATPIDDAMILVNWVTNEASDSRIVYWKVGSTARDSVVSSNMVKEHTVTVTGLMANTEYGMLAVSTDASGNQTRTALLRTVKTKKAPDFSPPDFIAPPMVDLVSSNGAVISWTNDEPAMAVVKLTGPGGDSLIQDARSVAYHQLTIGGLKASTRYSFAIQSTDQAGNISPYRAGQQFTTRAAADAQPPRVIQRPVSVPSENGVIISWGADELHTATIVIRKAGQVGAGVAELYSDVPSLAHVARTGGLAASTSYDYVVTVEDLAGNSIASRPYTFRTLAALDETPSAHPAWSVGGIRDGQTRPRSVGD